MALSLMLALAALTVASPAAPRAALKPAPTCPEQQLAKSTRAPTFRRLGELPPAETYMAVFRVDSKGCLDPLTAAAYRRSLRR